ncbi:MAG TPA: hypothetical protein DDY13_14455 [Cytophagales bacterium]|jgi:hypothetical protein|nr:hypothetical protein [Cytophagales bacterium]
MLPQIHLYTTYYQEHDPFRNQELITCLENNLANDSISTLTVLNEGGDLSEFRNPKLQIIPIKGRPTYQDFIDYINGHKPQEDLHIISNTDIYFDKHIAVLHYLDLKETCLALSRWDTTGFNRPKLYNKSSSQDVWIFQGAISSALKADFHLGVPRCDNRFMYELEEAGYKVLNPAFSIKALHIHEGQRHLEYDRDDNSFSIPPPYRYKYPHNIYGLWATLFFNWTHSCKLGPYRYDLKKLNRWWVIRLPRKILELLSGKKMPLIGFD